MSNFEDIALTDFSAGVYHMAADRSSVLMPVVEKISFTGALYTAQRLDGTTSVSPLVNRLGEPEASDLNFTIVAVAPSTRSARFKFDGAEEARNNLSDPSSLALKEISKEMADTYDQTIIDALLGDTRTGRDGAGTESFDSSMVIAAAATGLTREKVNAAIKAMRQKKQRVDVDELVLLIDEHGEEDIQNDSTFLDQTSSAGVADFSAGVIGRCRRAQVLVTTLMPTVSGSETRALLFTRDAVRHVVNHGVKTEMISLSEGGVGSKMLKVDFSSAALRMDPKKVVDIRLTY